ncbi:MAG TPA: hypothetical protein VHI13_14220 [Candidatus Kapabacteria bacterium]|nr:hypothetical protein [Candidatus Kapabacteria bacterium]
MVEPFEPYSARLAHGTLLLMHGPILRHRFAAIRHGIMLDAFGFLLAGGIVSGAGLLGGVLQVMLTGIAIILMSGILWCWRTYMMHRRQHETPTMIFVSNEGISGIMPDNRSITIGWPGLSAHETWSTPSLLSSRTTEQDRRAWHGLMLRGSGRERIHLMHDLEGFEDMLCVLADLAVPLFSRSSRVRSLYAGPPGEMVRG